MELDLELLAIDFKEWGAHVRLHKSERATMLSFVDVYEEGCDLKPGRVYVESPENLNLESIRQALFAPSFILTKEPTEDLLSSKANLLWFDTPLSKARIVSLAAERFDFYNKWERDLLMSVNRGDSIRRIGEISEPVFNRPLFMWDSLFQTVFAVWDESHYVLPEGFLKHEDMTPWPAEEVNAVDHYLTEMQESAAIYILPPVFGYRSLCQNIFLDEEFLGTVSVDEIGVPFNNRDRILLNVLTRHLADNLRFNPTVVMSTTYSLRENIEGLLLGQNIITDGIKGELDRLGWCITDSYFCAVAASENPFYSDALLSIKGDHIARKLDNAVYAIFKHAIVLFVNQSIESRSIFEERKIRMDSARRIASLLESEDITATVGVSNTFHNFLELACYHQQARWALGLGASADPNNHLFCFDDFLINHVIQVALQDTVSLTLCPDGLVRLSLYDEQNGTDLVKTLETYLDCGMSSAKTASTLFIHRNTLIHRLRQIEQVSNLDLSDSNVQLAVRFGLRVIKAKR